MPTAANRLVLISALGLLSAACSGGATSNPPPPAPEPAVTPEPAAEPIATAPEATAPEATAPEATAPAATAPPAPRKSASFSEMGKLLNPSTTEGKRIYVSSDGSCFIQLPFADGPRPPGSTPPRGDVACPPEIAGDEAWRACSGGAIHLPKTPDAQDKCICFQSGNPPPPPRWIGCPTHRG